ncbi:MAG: type III PLP-dependent enzyme [Paracoccaceae bacterium]
MQTQTGIWPSPLSHLSRVRPDHPVLYLCPSKLQATARRFQAGFPGLVTYAVKANPDRAVLENLTAAGINAFDVASPTEMRAVREVNPDATLHYNNPVRSRDEIAAGIAAGVVSWSVDEAGELAKLTALHPRTEIAVRFKLPVSGAAYDFGEKFGATPEEAAKLLRQITDAGYTPALCFHPGTQCMEAEAWAKYIHAAASIAEQAGVRIARLNVGGGFPVARDDGTLPPEPVFSAIERAKQTAFGPTAPALVCEPGRAMVGEAATLATRVKSLRGDGTVFLNEGIYGGLADIKDSGPTTRLRIYAPDGTPRTGDLRPVRIFGPTCDSLDVLPDGLQLSDDIEEGDFVLFDGHGAYSACMTSAFNGYGLHDVVTVLSLSGQSGLEG